MGYLASIKTLLTGESHIYISDYNDAYDNIVCITPYLGNPTHTFDSTIRKVYVQIMLRDTSSTSLETRAESIISTLDRYESTSMAIFLSDDVIPGKRDEKKRSISYINFEVILK